MGFFRWFFWGFLGGFFNANPVYKEIQNGAVAALVFTTLVTLKIMEKYQKISLKFNFSMKKIWGKHRCGTMPFISTLQNV